MLHNSNSLAIGHEGTFEQELPVIKDRTAIAVTEKRSWVYSDCSTKDENLRLLAMSDLETHTL